MLFVCVRGIDRRLVRDGRGVPLRVDVVHASLEAADGFAEAQKLLDLIDRIDMMWRETGGPKATRMQSPPAA